MALESLTSRLNTLNGTSSPAASSTPRVPAITPTKPYYSVTDALKSPTQFPEPTQLDRRLSILTAKPAQPKGFVNTVVGDLASQALPALGNYMRQEEAKRSQMSLGQKFKYDIIQKPAGIVKFLVQGAASIPLAIGRSMQDVAGMPNAARDSNRNERVKRWEEKIFGTEVESYQQITESLQEMIDYNPESTSGEKKYLAPLLGVALFASDAWPGKPNVKKQALKLAEEIAEETSEKAIRNKLIKTGVQKDIASSMAKKLVDVNDTAKVREVLTREAAEGAARIVDTTPVQQVDNAMEKAVKTEPTLTKVIDTTPEPTAKSAELPRGDVKVPERAPTVAKLEKTLEDGAESFYRSADNGARFEKLQEQDILPAPIQDGLDTFVVKVDDGFDVIEGQSGQQLGETGKSVAEAIKSAKQEIEQLGPDGLSQAINDAPVSPRYTQPTPTRELPKVEGVTTADRIQPTDRAAERRRLKLVAMAKRSSTVDNFVENSGISRAALDKTVQKQGFKNVEDYFEKNGPGKISKSEARRIETPKTEEQPKPNLDEDTELQSFELLAEQQQGSEYVTKVSTKESSRVTNNLRQVFADMKGIELDDPKLKFTEEDLFRAETEYEFMLEALMDDPARALSKYANKNGELPEVTGKKGGVFARRGDDLVTELGFESSEQARTAYAAYLKRKEKLNEVLESFREVRRGVRLAKQMDQFVGDKKKKLATDLLRSQKALSSMVQAAERAGFKRGYKSGNEKYKTLVNNLRERRSRLSALQNVYDLTDGEFAKIRGKKDPRFMTKAEFDQYLANVETAAQKLREQREERVIVDALISEKGLKKVDNLRKAMQLPKLKNMSAEQLRSFSDILVKTEPGDTFLSPRMIQTAKNTELGDIKTMAEGRKAVADKLGIEASKVTETADADVFLDAFLRDPAWAERDPLRKTVVMDWAAADIQRLNKEALLRQEISKLAKASRKSRRKAGGVTGSFREKMLSRFAKTDDYVADYLETLPENLPALEKKMTPEEIEFGKFGRELMQKYYQYAVDDSAQRWTLAGVRNSRFKDMYLPHMGPQFFERWKNNGFVKAVRTIFDTVQDSKVDFNAYGDRGEVIGYEKFFKNNLKRENIEADAYSKNVADVLLRYTSAFENKIMLDSMTPKIKLLEQLLGRKYRTPKTITNPDGVEKVSSSLTRVLNEWINGKKGQKIETLRIQQGSQVEKFLQSSNMLISIMDLGGNLVTQTASGVGGELFNVLAHTRGKTGVKGWIKGHTRSLTKQGRKIARNNPGVIEVAPWLTLADSFHDAGQTLMSGLFYVFADLSYRARRQLMLGLLTKEEFKTGVISAKRLAEIKLEIGKVHALPEFRSVQGKTALVQLANKYTEWATPNFQTSALMLNQTVKDLKQAKLRGGMDGVKQFMKTDAYRQTMTTVLVGVGAYALGKIVFEPEEQKTPLEKWQAKVAREMSSIIQSMSGIGVFGSSRSMDMIQQLQNLITTAITLERYKSTGPGYEEGDLKAVNAAKRFFTPAFVRQFLSTGSNESVAAAATTTKQRVNPNRQRVNPNTRTNRVNQNRKRPNTQRQR